MVIQKSGRAADGGPTRRQQAAVETRKKLVAAARRLFTRHGFEAVTTEQIAGAAGVAKGTLFLHARTKEHLLVMVYEDELGATLRRKAPRIPPSGSVVTALMAVFRRFFEVHEKDPALARRFVAQVLAMGPHEAPVLRAVQEDALRGLAALVAERQRRGEVAPDVDPELAAQTSFLLYYGVLTAWLNDWVPDAATRDRMLASSLDLHWRGLVRERVRRRRTRER